MRRGWTVDIKTSSATATIFAYFQHTGH